LAYLKYLIGFVKHLSLGTSGSITLRFLTPDKCSSIRKLIGIEKVSG